MLPPWAMAAFRSRASTACFCASVIAHSSRYARSSALNRARFSGRIRLMQNWFRA